MKQLPLFKTKIIREFGGSLLKGRRKTARPLSTKKPIHIVLKATSPWLLLKQQTEIKTVIKIMSRRFGVKDYSAAIHADHIHLVVRLHSRALYRKWIRAVTSLLVARIKGLNFSLRPYSVIVSWGRQFRSALNYLKINRDEGDLMTEAYEVMELWRSTIFSAYQD